MKSAIQKQRLQMLAGAEFCGGLLFFLLLLALPCAARPQEFFDLGRRSPDVIFQTRLAGTGLGYSFAVGDLNGDGKADLAIGAPGMIDEGAPQAGAVYVFWGGRRLPAMIDFISATADAEIVGHPPSSGAGAALVCADLNGDHIDDLVVGAPFANREELFDSGVVEVLFGRADFPEKIDLRSGGPDALIHGELESDEFGRVLSAGDFNGDGIADLLVAAPGARSVNGVASGMVYLIQGRTSWSANLYVGADPTDVTFIPGKEPNNFTATSLAVGNFNGDEFDDFLIGTHKANFLERVDCGETCLVLGRSPLPATFDLRAADLLIAGRNVRDFSGWAVGAADFNSDGRDEMVISVPGAQHDDLPDAGEAGYFHFDDATSDTIDLTTSPALFSVWGPHRSSRLANSLIAADVNNDGIADVLHGIPADSSLSGLEGAGSLAVVYGRAGLAGNLDLSAESPDLAIIGGEVNSAIGRAFAAGDFDDDGKTDIVLKTSAGGGNNTVYLIYGPSLITSVAREFAGSIAPETFALQSNYPNPFNRNTRFAIDVFAAFDLKVVIYDLLGRRVRTLFAGRLSAGQKVFEWDGLSDASQRLPVGTYFVRASATASGRKIVRALKLNFLP
jgi:hypothetical protein